VGREPASFQDTVQAMGPRSEALRRSSADSDGPVGGAILLHHDSRRDRGDGARRVALSELSEALMNLGQKREEGKGVFSTRHIVYHERPEYYS